jgi:hypothetical protein
MSENWSAASQLSGRHLVCCPPAFACCAAVGPLGAVPADGDAVRSEGVSFRAGVRRWLDPCVATSYQSHGLSFTPGACVSGRVHDAYLSLLGVQPLDRPRPFAALHETLHGLSDICGGGPDGVLGSDRLRRLSCGGPSGLAARAVWFRGSGGLRPGRAITGSWFAPLFSGCLRVGGGPRARVRGPPLRGGRLGHDGG